MDYPIRQAQGRLGYGKRVNVRLLAETALVTTAAIMTLRLLLTSSGFGSAWYVGPAVLLAAGLIPTLIKKDEFVSIGLSREQFRHSLTLVVGVCIFVFPALAAGLWLLKLWGMQLPLRPVLPREQGLAQWLLYQFLYVAVAEEVFFRGYVQRNFLRLIDSFKERPGMLLKFTSIVVSAACFALAHAIVQGEIVSFLTFLPGLILGWIFIRTGSLLAPILFHGLANAWYLGLCGLLASF
jgi:membrane protease YdiL (CAAX protease family)